MPTRRSWRDDQRLWGRAQCRQQRQLGDRYAEIVVFFFKAERARHAATAGVKNSDLQSRHEAQGGGGALGAAKRFLMAVGMQEAFLRSLPQLQVAAARFGLVSQPVVRQIHGGSDVLGVR